MTKTKRSKATSGLHHLRHWLVAHAKNDHRPHLIRRQGLIVAAVLIALVQVTGYFTQPAAHGAVLAYATDINIGELFRLTNQQRAANGLGPLHLDARLNNSAALKASNMFSENYWAHVSPSGIQPWYWFGQAGYSYTYAGENLAKDFDTTSGVMDGWMNSPGHRANVLNANYVDVGFAVANGTLVGGQTTLVVAHYGAGAGSSVSATVAAAPRAPAAAAPSAPKVVAAAPTPAATPASTPAPTVAPSPRPSPVVAVGSVTELAPSPASYRPITPLAAARSVSPATRATFVILLVLFLVYLQTHVIVWRKGLKRWRKLHYRLWAGAQLSSLVLVMVVLVGQGFGHVS